MTLFKCFIIFFKNNLWYKEGSKEGEGVFIYKDGSKYEGQVQNNMKNGHGVLSWSDGRKYTSWTQNIS